MTACKRPALVATCLLVCCFVFPSLAAAQRDSLLNGTMVGLGVGLTAGAVIGFSDLGGPLSKRYCENESPGSNCNVNATVTSALFGALGAGLGAWIDSTRWSRVNRPIRERPLDIAPIVHRDRKGMAVRLKF
jgi:hypothetical protein